jgi:membrane fusion protein
MDPNLPVQQPLFRHEAVAQVRRSGLGEILLAQPNMSWSWAFSAWACAGGILLFMFLGEYTRRERVTGQISLSAQTIKHYSPVPATVAERYVKDGALVEKGAPLLRLYIDRTVSAKGESQAAILSEIAARRQKLFAEQALQGNISTEDVLLLKRRRANFEMQLAQLDSEIGIQEKRLRSNAENLGRTKQLADQDIISAAELQDKEQEQLSIQAQAEGLKRSRYVLMESLTSVTSDLRNAPLKALGQSSALSRSINELEQQAIETESRREIKITALASGTVTGLLVAEGQQVNATTNLLSILPVNSVFEAQLYIPTRAIGFTQPGNKVLLRYEAFPYQKFGQATGTIKSIDMTALSPAELQMLGDKKEPFYRAVVTLSEQRVKAYGKLMPLHDGMQLDADIPIDARKLFEWVLEPLYTVRGQMQ